MAACVPKRVINNYEYTDFFSEEEVKKVVDKIGVYERRFADKDICSSDLCYAAAEKLLTDNNINRNEIDLLIFISQTGDYRMPATAFLLQNRLQLSNSAIAFDINLGCSGFIYGLLVVYSIMQNSNLRKALLLNGETRSKVYSPKDRQSAFIFGDAGTATLIEPLEDSRKSWFSLNSDGSKGNLIMIPGGGYRLPSSPETLSERVVDDHGNIRNLEQGFMKGSDVFTFVMTEVPKDIKKLFQISGQDVNSIDWFLFHQANNFINKHIAKRLKLDFSKIPSTIQKYGNTSSVSIPLTIVDSLYNSMKEPGLLMLSAFGVGMSWATAILPYQSVHISPIVEI